MATSIPQYAKALYEFLDGVPEKEWDERLKQFVLFLKSERILKKKNAIIRAFEQYAKEQEGEVDITITAAHPLNGEVVAHIKKICHTKGDATVIQDTTVIGGVKIKRGNIIIDASMKTQLERLQHALEA